MFSGKDQNAAYSLSRWTDVPAAKWPWFRARLQEGHMLGIDPRSGLGVPGKWSLKPEDTLGMVFWTRDSRNMLQEYDILEPYNKAVHFTITGWHEAEKGAPRIDDALAILRDTIQVFGVDRVTWRFSPIPLVLDVVPRFERLAEAVGELGLREVYVSFLQPNDLLPETRKPKERAHILNKLAEHAPHMQVKLCNEDQTGYPFVQPNLSFGVCEPGTQFMTSKQPENEGCGCAYAIDPFTINETCVFGCAYCYAADRRLAPKKRNTTRLTVL